MSTFNILITGTKAGIGHGLLVAYAARPNTQVVCAIRDGPDSENAKNMVAKVTNIGSGSSIIVVKYDAAVDDSAQQMFDYVHSTHPSIQYLDCVVANAGVADNWVKCTSITPEQLRFHYAVNTVGPVMLYQASRELLIASKGSPKFFVISSVVGSVQIGPGIGFELPAYGTSKAAVNWFMRKANGEEDRIVVAAVSPGWCQSEMGNRAAGYLQQEAAPMKVEESVDGLLKIFDETDKAGSNGLFLHVAGNSLPW